MNLEKENPLLSLFLRPQMGLRHIQLRVQGVIFLRYGGKRCILTLCFPRRLRLRHKLHLEQWKKSSLGPILQREVSGQGRAPRNQACPPARTCRCRTARSGTASCHGQTGGRCRSSTRQRGCHSPRSAAGPEGTGTS